MTTLRCEPNPSIHDNLDALLRHTAKAVVIVLLLFLFVSRASGDITNVTDYNVSGILTITGNNACSPLSACAETISFSFMMQSYVSGGTYFQGVIPGSGTVLASLGPLGSFSFPEFGIDSGGCPGLVDRDCNYIPFLNGLGDEIDIDMNPSESSTPLVPMVLSTNLYGCRTPTCVTDFAFPPFITSGIYRPGEVDATVTVIPEPSTILLLAFGLFAVAVLRGALCNYPLKLQ